MDERVRSLIKASTRGKVLENEPLSRHTSLRVGGPADLLLIPADMEELRSLLALLESEGVPRLLLGGGYNLLVRDGGFRGAVISLKGMDRLEDIGNGSIFAEAGAGNASLARFAADRGLTGLEFLAGIPGTVGGALAMNAGAHGEAILERVVELATLKSGRLTVTAGKDLVFGYRFIRLEENEVIVSARFQLAAGNREEIEEKSARLLEQRRASQSVGFPNAGSFFKNPVGYQAWQLIDRAGLRGLRIGNAQVSEKHANFLVNLGGATAADLLNLARSVRERVREESGIDLEEEVRIVGED